jgi:predicted dehydrogenase
MMEPVPFALVGSGWRAAFFERVATALPEQFRLTGRYSVRLPGTAASLDELVAGRPAFVVLAVPRDATPTLLSELAERGVAVLAETPPAVDIDGLRRLAPLAKAGPRIQVAEQYRFQPLHAARLAIVEGGRLGAISQVQASVAHGYHGIDLVRRFLGVVYEPVTISARRFVSPVVAGPDRAGPPQDARTIQDSQVLATFDFGDRLGILDFADEQYFSKIRSLRMLIRGDRGEIDGRDVRWLADDNTPARVSLERHDTGHDGNLEGLYLEGITAGAEWVYRNPFGAARLTDDELAVATCLARMPEAIDGGPDVCSLADAVHDRYLDLLVEEAIRTGGPVRAAGHLWDERQASLTREPV